MITDLELADELEEAANHQSPAVLSHVAMKVVKKLRERDWPIKEEITKNEEENSGESDTKPTKPGATKVN